MSKQRGSAEPLQCCAALGQAALDDDQAADLARVFKALADPVRVKLFSMIASRPEGETCVCELTPAFELSAPTISHHLKVLREAGLISSERRGTWVYCQVVPGVLERLSGLFAALPGESYAAMQPS